MYIIRNGEKVMITNIDRVESYTNLAEKLDLFSWILIGIIIVLVLALIYVCVFMKCEDPAKSVESKPVESAESKSTDSKKSQQNTSSNKINRSKTSLI
jgi:hypothetical protein